MKTMYVFVVYFFTITNNGTSYIVDTMPVDDEKSCMKIVKTVNSQPTKSGRKVRATCYVAPAK